MTYSIQNLAQKQNLSPDVNTKMISKNKFFRAVEDDDRKFISFNPFILIASFVEHFDENAV